MSIHNTAEHKNTDASPVNDSPRTNNCVETYPATPVVHAATVYVQIEDDNELYEWVSDNQRDLNELRTEPGTTDKPHLVASEYSPTWDKRERKCEIGLFSSTTGYGEIADDGSLIRSPDHHLGLYEDTTAAKKPPLPAKCKLIIEKREDGLQTSNGHEFRWPPGANGNRWEGTYLKIQTSYITEPMDAVERAEEMLSTAFNDFNSFREFGNLIPEMCRVQGLEAYIRYLRDHAEPTVRELEQSASLTVKGDTKGKTFEQSGPGECTNYSFTTTRMDHLGFDTCDLDRPPKKIKLKTYAAKNYNRRPVGDPLRHWKLEAKIYGAYPWNQWADLLRHARRVVCSHALWAGIREDELVPDEWFLSDGQSQDPFSFQHPVNRRDQLTEFYHSEVFKRAVRGRLFHTSTKSYYDLLCVLLNRHNNQITYQEAADEIGLTKDTIGRIAGKLEEDGIVVRCYSAVGFIRWQSQPAKDTVRQLLDRDMTEAERRVKIEERAAERRRDREAQREREDDSEETDENETDQWVDVSESEVNIEELAERIQSGDIAPKDISFRPGG